MLIADSYKYSHWLQYPESMTYMHDYLESRGEDGSADENVPGFTRFFGLQYYVKRYLSKPFTQEDVDEAEQVIAGQGLPFNREGWEHILHEHGGFMPVKIRAVREGTVAPSHNVLMTVESTCEQTPWIVGWLETLLMKVWYPTTVATLSYSLRELLKKYLEESADDLSKLPFMLQDFGYRGVSSEESAGIGGAAHLTNFKGTDTVAGVAVAHDYYGAKGVAGVSIPAAEHSTITSWGAGRENEQMAFRNMIDKFGSEGTYAVVSDSWDYARALETWGGLAPEVKAREGTLVVRPDSGDNVANVVLALKTLDKYYGSTVNSKGYKVIDHAAVIQGDGNDYDAIDAICKATIAAGYSVDNLAFGMGGALLQGGGRSSVNRDTHKFAIKCSAAVINGQLVDVYKDPVTDRGKRSKRGRLDLVRDKRSGEYKTIVLDPGTYPDMGYAENTELVTYYEDGEVLVDQKFEDIQLG